MRTNDFEFEAVSINTTRVFPTGFPPKYNVPEIEPLVDDGASLNGIFTVAAEASGLLAIPASSIVTNLIATVTAPAVGSTLTTGVGLPFAPAAIVKPPVAGKFAQVVVGQFPAVGSVVPAG